jgi:hypothetical protein
MNSSSKYQRWKQPLDQPTSYELFLLIVYLIIGAYVLLCIPLIVPNLFLFLVLSFMWIGFYWSFLVLSFSRDPGEMLRSGFCNRPMKQHNQKNQV